MNCVLFDDASRLDLLPFTFTRPIADIRVGVLTIREKWEFYLNEETSSLTEEYLKEKFPYKAAACSLFINGSVLPEATLVIAIQILKPFQGLYNKDILLAVHIEGELLQSVEGCVREKIEYTQAIFKIDHVWDIFLKNDAAIRADFTLLTEGRTSEEISDTNTVLGKENIFIEAGARVECAILNGTCGPIYIGKDSEIMEGCMVRGPFALGEHAVLKLGTKIYGATTVGPYSKAGGELSNAVLFGYSNKGHDGFLGNAVIGEWCNLGADTNTSNLKNNYSDVQLWSYASKKYQNTHLTFCGLMMGDHSKCGINTMFNTGTVVGVSANIFGSGFPSKHIPSFSWGGAHGFQTYMPEKAREVASKVFERRDLEFTDVEYKILLTVHGITKEDRVWENADPKPIVA